VRRNEFVIQLWFDRHFASGKVEEWREGGVAVAETSCVGETGVGISKFIEEFVGEGVEGGETGCGGILQEVL
jgi:hypothetical protein